MKTSAFILLFTASQIMVSQDTDTTLFRFGLLVDYNNAVVNAAGFKYRQTREVAYFIRGSFSKENTTLSVLSNDRSEGVDTFSGYGGIEYSVLTIDNISLLTIFSAGMTVSTYSRPYITDQLVYMGNRDSKYVMYSVQAGIGAEYFFSDHLSLSGVQSMAFDYSKNEGNNGNYTPSIKTSTAFKLVYTKITGAFYF